MGGAAGTKKAAVMSVFMHADAMDMALMVLGPGGRIGDGFSTPVKLLITSFIINDLGSSGPDHLQELSSKMDEGRINKFYTTHVPIVKP